MDQKNFNRSRKGRKNESKSRFFFFVSNELKTPPNSILSYTDMLSYDSLDGQQAEMITNIRASGKMQLGLTMMV